jgi:hypothetical protein
MKPAAPHGPRRGAIYRKTDLLVVHPTHESVQGFALAGAPVLKVALPATDAEIGETIRRALAGWRHGVPHPTHWPTFGKEFLQVAGFRSWKALQDGALYCVFREDAGNLCFQPLAKSTGQSYEGFGAPPEIVAAASAPDAIGAAAMRALARAR